MPGRDGTGPTGNDPNMGKRRGGGRCRSRNDKSDISRGTDGMCVCPKCGYEMSHKPGVPCSEIKCEKCGTLMVRK